MLPYRDCGVHRLQFQECLSRSAENRVRGAQHRVLTGANLKPMSRWTHEGMHRRMRISVYILGAVNFSLVRAERAETTTEARKYAQKQGT